MTIVRVILSDKSKKSVVVKIMRMVFPTIGISEVLKRIDLDQPLVELQLYTANHDETVRSLQTLTVELDKVAAPFRLVKVVRGEAGGDEKMRELTEIIDSAGLRQLHVRLQKIKKEQQEIAELEDETD